MSSALKDQMSGGTGSIAVGFLFFSDGNEWQGGKNYFRALFGALDADSKRNLQIFAFFGKHTDPAEFRFPTSVTCIQSSALDRRSPAWLFDRVCKLLFGRTPLLTRRLKLSGIRVLSHCDPRESSAFPCIAWIPDFQHMHLPQFFQPEELAARDAQFKIMLARAERIIVSSHAAKIDIANFSPIYADKARVLQFCSVTPEQQPNQAKELKHLYGLPERFFFIPNQLWLHKNHRVALDALLNLRSRWPDIQIVCSGAMSDRRNPTHIDELKRRIEELELSDNFRLLGLIPYPHITGLMARSVAVINPSYFEGWSTTVEEAKALGTPLILSDLPVHHEQCPGNEALFFSPNDSEALAQCMEQVLTGIWPALRGDRVAVALARHQEWTIAFSRTYQSIVQELPSLDAPLSA